MSEIKIKDEFVLSKILSYFLRGLVFLVPIALTSYIILKAIQWIDGLIPVGIPGLGILIVFSSIVLIGYLGNTFVAKPFFLLLERAITRVPLVNFIYSSINDLIGAFFGNNKKFDHPVLVQMDKDGILFKPGFITAKNLDTIGLPGMVAVYFPHSYNFSGNIFLVNSKNVKRINGSISDVMKYIVSGGVSGKLGNLSTDGPVAPGLQEGEKQI